MVLPLELILRKLTPGRDTEWRVLEFSYTQLRVMHQVGSWKTIVERVSLMVATPQAIPISF